MQGEICGTGLTPFCAIGRLHFYSPVGTAAVSIPSKEGSCDDFTLELSRLEIAAEAARDKLEGENERGDISEIFDRIYEKARFEIFGGAGAREAVARAVGALFFELSGGLDPCVSHLSVLCAEIAGHIDREFSDGGKGGAKRLSPVILIATGIDERELERLDKKMLLGLVLPNDTPLSPCARLAHSLGIPLIVGCEQSGLAAALENRNAVIDGEKGVVIIDPAEEIIENYAMRLGELSRNSPIKNDRSLKRLALITHEHELDNSACEEADGIGLLSADKIMNGGTEHFFSLIRSVAESMGGREVRVLLPGDEKGKRAVLEGALRATEYGRVAVALPAVTSASELKRLKCEILSLELGDSENIGICAIIANGAALVMCREIAAACDAALVDCDSLMLSLLSPMRESPTEEEINSNEECLLKALGTIADACRAAGIPVGVCGTLVTKKSLRDKLSPLGISELVLAPPYLDR